MEFIEASQNWRRIPLISLDPRTKLAILILINIVVFTSKNILAEILCIGLIGATLFALGAARKAIRGIGMYSLLLVVLWVFRDSHSYISTTISMVVITLRKLMPTAFFAGGFISTTKISELISALQKLRLPKSLIITLAVTMRFFPTVKEEYMHIRDAMKLKGIGLNFKNVLLHPLTLSEYILIPVMLRCSNIADELSAAATTRGIESDQKRTSLYEPSFSGCDSMALSAFFLLGIFSVMSGVFL